VPKADRSQVTDATIWVLHYPVSAPPRTVSNYELLWEIKHGVMDYPGSQIALGSGERGAGAGSGERIALAVGVA